MTSTLDHVDTLLQFPHAGSHAAAERADLLALLEQLAPEQWTRPPCAAAGGCAMWPRHADRPPDVLLPRSGVRGPGEAILLATAGRNAAVDELSGPGVATLRPRLDQASRA